MDTVLLEILKQVNDVAPKVLEIYIRRAHVVVMADIIWGLIFVSAAIMVCSFVLKAKKENDFSDWDDFVAPIIVSALCLVFGLCLITSGLMWAGNVEYFAVTHLLRDLTGN